MAPKVCPAWASNTVSLLIIFNDKTLRPNTYVVRQCCVCVRLKMELSPPPPSPLHPPPPVLISGSVLCPAHLGPAHLHLIKPDHLPTPPPPTHRLQHETCGRVRAGAAAR